MSESEKRVVWFETVGRGDVARVGGKNASLGEMVQALASAGVSVPAGFATTAQAYRDYLDANAITGAIAERLDRWETGTATLAQTGEAIRSLIRTGSWPQEIADEIVAAYRALGERVGRHNPSVAVRSSATAEDLPDASFAGQQESFLNVCGEPELLDACRRCFASLFTDRALSYRRAKGFDHTKVALSIGVQLMVRSDTGGSGVMFSIDTETGFDKVVLINAAWGLGENVVQGAVDPDEYQVYKPLLDRAGVVPIVDKSLGGKAIKMVYGNAETRTRNVPTSRAEREAFVLSDEEILRLTRWAVAIEAHYGCPMDMEWARDGETGAISIVQARPETVQARKAAGSMTTYSIESKGDLLCRGIAIGDAAVSGDVCLIEDPSDIGRFVDGAVLVTRTTDPDWVPIMKRASAIVTDHGGRTSHAAIVSRELGLPAVVGTGNATYVLHTGQTVGVSCAEGEVGFVYAGPMTVSEQAIDISDLPRTRTRVMLNLANPAAASRWWRLPADGVGLARMEFVITNVVRAHPMALVHYESLRDEAARNEIAAITRGYPDKAEYFVDTLARGLARIAAVFHPRPVIVRMSDFKTNEYAGLIGGAQFEPHEDNPMIGFRGAARYASERYRDGFMLECRAIRRLREEMGFDNVVVMIPFCRSVEEADKVLTVMEHAGLARGRHGLKVYMMTEIPANVILAQDFAQRFDGFSIGSNDLTQLTLGIDRDSEDLAPLFDEQGRAIKWMITHAIEAAHAAGDTIGICGQAPSDHPDFAQFLVEAGIDSISVSPDSFVAVKRKVASVEALAHKAMTRRPETAVAGL